MLWEAEQPWGVYLFPLTFLMPKNNSWCWNSQKRKGFTFLNSSWWMKPIKQSYVLDDLDRLKPTSEVEQLFPIPGSTSTYTKSASCPHQKDWCVSKQQQTGTIANLTSSNFRKEKLAIHWVVARHTKTYNWKALQLKNFYYPVWDFNNELKIKKCIRLEKIVTTASQQSCYSKRNEEIAQQN